MVLDKGYVEPMVQIIMFEEDDLIRASSDMEMIDQITKDDGWIFGWY